MRLDMDFSRKNICGKVGSMRQLASIRRAVLDDGKGRNMRIVDVDNGSGLKFTVYPDRGMDIGEARYKGIPLVWLTPACGTPEEYEPEQFNWLRSWGGGFLTGCGLLNVGGPCEAGGENHSLHGRLSHLKACDLNTDSKWLDDETFELTVSGKVIHSKVFGENLQLTRKIAVQLGVNAVVIEDAVENCGFKETPFMLLYHMNFSWPLVNENAHIDAPEHPVTPQNDIAAAGLSQWNRMSLPVSGFAEQVFYHDLPADENGMAGLKLVNPDLKLAMKITYSKATLPFMVQWKQMGQGEYVLGLEPGNCIPEGQVNNASKGVLKTICPGEVIRHKVVVAFEDLGQ